MFLGLDLGTSGLKGVIIGDDDRLIAEAGAPLSVHRAHPGWSEQDPADWIAAVEVVLEALARKVDMAALRGIGLSGQMHGATLVGKDGRTLRPCILWSDTRAAEEAAAMDADSRWRAVSGNIVFPGFTAPKLAWVKAHEPKVFAQIDKVLLPKDFLRLWLTGEAVSDMSDAAGTSWLDVGGRDWSDDLLAATDLGRQHMPSLVEGSEVSGGLRGDIARRFGLRKGIPIAGGGGDNAASAIGVGVVEAGQAFVSLGTSGVLFAASDAYRPDPATAVHTFCHALPERWHQMGVILSASDALSWYGRLVGMNPADLTAELGPKLRAPGAATFLPYLGGERTPHNDSRIRASLTGLDHAAGRAEGTAAVVEGVAFAIRDCRDALAATGTRIDRITAVGGGSRSDYWLAAIATALDLPVDVPEAGDLGGAFGAARLGHMAATGGGAELAPPPAIRTTIDPVDSLTDAFTEAHGRYRATYAALKTLQR